MEAHVWYAPCPQGFTSSVFKTEGSTVHSVDEVWSWLSRKETFSKGQIPPYNVEFMGDQETVYFEQGNYNNHHGPFLHLPAHVTIMKPPSFREMQYLYGSYVVSYRLIRPIALRIHVEKRGDETVVMVELHAYLRPFLKRLWESLNGFFWNRFFFSSLRKLKAI